MPFFYEYLETVYDDIQLELARITKDFCLVIIYNSIFLMLCSMDPRDNVIYKCLTCKYIQ